MEVWVPDKPTHDTHPNHTHTDTPALQATSFPVDATCRSVW
jgi:hypothetical protein